MSAPDRFPGFDALDQVGHWDNRTTEVVLERLRERIAVTFFSASEIATVDALVRRILGDTTHPITAMVGARLARGETDGWRYDDLPEDGAAWRLTLGLLDDDALAAHDAPFEALSAPAAQQVLTDIEATGGGLWHGLIAAHVWSLWTRYLCAAFYSHPAAWTEIGFPGPAYPRGYGNLGLDRLEPWEVRDSGERESQ